MCSRRSAIPGSTEICRVWCQSIFFGSPLLSLSRKASRSSEVSNSRRSGPFGEGPDHRDLRRCRAKRRLPAVAVPVRWKEPISMSACSRLFAKSRTKSSMRITPLPSCREGDPYHRSPCSKRSKASRLPIASLTGLWSCVVSRSRFHPCVA